MRHATAVAVITLALIVGTSPGGRAQTTNGAAAAAGSGHDAGHQGSSARARSGAATAGVGAVRGVTGEAQKPVHPRRHRDAGAVQGAGTAK